MPSLTFDEYQSVAYSTSGEHESTTDELVNWSLGVGGESGEIIDSVKKHVFHGHALNLQELEKELGDALWYLSAMCTCLGLRLEDVAAHNLSKLAKRYPTGFSHSGSINRVE